MNAHLNRCLIVGSLLVGSMSLRAAESTIPRLLSPDERIAVEVHLTDRITFDVTIDDQAVMKGSAVSLQVENTVFGHEARLLSAKASEQDGVVTPPVRQKAASFRDRYHELRLSLEGGATIVFRAYNEGVAYRWETSLPQAEVKVMNEGATFAFASNTFAYFPEEQGFFSHNERFFLPRALADLSAHNLASIPAVVDAGKVKIAICDSDIEDYPGLWLRGTNTAALSATFPPYPLKEELTGDRDFRVTTAADYIAKTKGTRTYPWRVMGVAYKDGDLIINPIVYLLQSPSRVADTSWIKPGKVAWDWWNANNLFGVDFKAGINTATYKAYIDFAAANNLQYIILDEGWYKLGNVLDVVPDINLEELVAMVGKRTWA